MENINNNNGIYGINSRIFESDMIKFLNYRFQIVTVVSVVLPRTTATATKNNNTGAYTLITHKIKSKKLQLKQKKLTDF